MKHCENFTFVIKFEDRYEVWNNFSIKYRGKIYPYDTYRVKNDGLHVCNTSDDLIQQRWRNFTVQDKQRIPYKHCNVTVDSFYPENYTLLKDFNVFFKPTNQNFTREDYGVSSGYFSICSAKLSLSCNDYLVIVKDSEQYNVFNNFSLIYNNKKYDYREYRMNNNMIEMCASNHTTALHIWKTASSLEKSGLLSSLRCNNPLTLNQRHYTVNKHFIVYYSPSGQYFRQHDYYIRYSKPIVCRETFEPLSTQYTEEDLLMCNDSIINIKYDDEYKVWNNFSILYKNKMYSYTEYRALDDSIKICNSTDDFVKNIWKLRNYWVMERRRLKSCNFDYWRFNKPYYSINKDFTVYESGTSQYFTKHDYNVIEGELVICKEIVRPNSFQYTKEDLLMCNDSIINIKYDDEYKVWNNFSILYKNKMYSYTEYRVLNDGIKICNSTDNFAKNIWKLRNNWVKEKRNLKSCNFEYWIFYTPHYTVNKDLTVYESVTSQYFTRHDYDVIDGQLVICKKILRPNSYQYTKEDLLMCNDSIINIKYDDEYKVWNDFSILYKNKMYSYTEYRALNDTIKICNSTNNFVKNVWNIRNYWVRATRHSKSCNFDYWRFNKPYYSINKDFAVYESGTSQYFTRHDYDVIGGELVICKKIVKPNSFQYIKEDLLMCNDSIINIKYVDEYKVWNNFSILYMQQMYSYTEYRALNDSIKICNSTDNFVKNVWQLRNEWVMGKRHLKTCNFDYWRFSKSFYSINKQFTVYESGKSQYFTKHNYGVNDGELVICKEIVKPNSYQYTKEDLLMCNDSIINVKYDDEYKVWNNFSMFYKNNMYSYTEYRALNDIIKICNSTDNFVKNIWKLRNSWVMGKRHLKSCNFDYWTFNKPYYTINKEFTVYESGKSQYFTKYNYGVNEGELVICKKILRPNSHQYTQADLLMCNDSIINVKYDDEYKVWKNFSILYKNKIYSYTEYRALNDSIKICNSTDNFVKNIWKLRNYWVIGRRRLKSCNFDYWRFNKPYYTINKHFTIYESGTSQYFTRHDYDVNDGELVICKEKVRPNSFQYTKEDLLMCNDSIINIKYDDEYKVWNNFSIIMTKKIYGYTEYRALNESIKICNSTDTFERNIWKLRNFWIMFGRIYNSCNKPVVDFPLYQGEYDALKNFTVLIQATKLLIAKNDYGIFNGIPVLCVNKCVNSTSTINYEDEYRVWSNFSMMYKGKMYNYFEYRVTDIGLQICNSSDRLIKEKWRNLTAFERRWIAYTNCNVHVGGFYHENYTVYKNFSVFFKPTKQNFTRQDYGVISGYFAICSESLNSSCEESLLEVTYGEQYEVFKNFSVFYKKKVYDNGEYRFSRNGVKICTSSDLRVQAIWKTQNKWGMSLGAPCDRSYKLNPEEYTITKRFAIHRTEDGQVFNRYEYSLIDDSPYVCKKPARPNYIITDVNIIVAPLLALALSLISLASLLIIYCLLPELRTLPGLNLMSLAIAFLFWQIYLVVFLSSYSLVGKLSTIPCETLFVITKFITYSIVLNAAVNIYHLRQTFCGNAPLKAEKLNKWRKFLKYSIFSWGVPVAVTIVYIVLVKTKALQFNQYATPVEGDVQSSLKFYQRIELAGEETNENVLKLDPHTLTSVTKNVAPYLRSANNFRDEGEPNISIEQNEPQSKRFYKRFVLGNKINNERIYQHITGDCYKAVDSGITPSWINAVDVYGIQCFLMLYIVVAFILTAYQIRQKLKAGQSIAQKSNIVTHRKFVLLMKLSTTTALSYWFPLFLSHMIDFNFDVKIAFYTVTVLTGAYIGIAFGFTRKNYQLLKKRFFPAKDRKVNNRVAANEFELKVKNQVVVASAN